MIVTPFGEFDLENERALARFLAAHYRSHVVYARRLSLTNTVLDSAVDGDWMLRHTALHVRLATLTGTPLASADVKALALTAKWRTQQELSDWSDLHSRHHLTIDRQLHLHT